MYPDPNQPNAPKPQPQVPPQQPLPSAQPQQYPQPGVPQVPAQPLTPPASTETTPQYSIDYLNQIAPKQQKAGLVGGRMFLFIIGGGLLLALIIGIMALSNGSSGPTTQMQTLAARIETLQSVASKSQKNIKSGKLRSTNSNLNIFLTNADHDIADPLLKSGVKIKSLDKNIVTAEKNEALTKKLEDARLNAVFDQTYAREMSYQLSTVENLMGKIYRSTKSKSMKDFLQKTNSNVDPIIKQLDSFNVTTAND